MFRILFDGPAPIFFRRRGPRCLLIGKYFVYVVISGQGIEMLERDEVLRQM